MALTVTTDVTEITEVEGTIVPVTATATGETTVLMTDLTFTSDGSATILATSDSLVWSSPGVKEASRADIPNTANNDFELTGLLTLSQIGAGSSENIFKLETPTAECFRIQGSPNNNNLTVKAYGNVLYSDSYTNGSQFDLQIKRVDGTLTVKLLLGESVLVDQTINDVVKESISFFCGYWYTYNATLENIVLKVGTPATVTFEKDTGSGYVEVSTDNPYNYTALLADNGGFLRAKAVAGEETAYSTPIPLTITPAGGCSIKQGALSVTVNPLYGQISTEIALSMERNLSSRGHVGWLDNGAQYDNYSGSVGVDTEEGEALENLLSGDLTDTIFLTACTANGFLPFGQYFAGLQEYPVNISTWKTNGDLDIFGNHRGYELKYAYVGDDIYNSLDINTPISGGCVKEHWTLGGVPFPFSEWTQQINDKRRFVQTGGTSSGIVDTTRLYGDVAKVGFQVWEEQARQILAFLCTVMRGTAQTAVFPAGYNIFGRRYEGITTCQVKLYSNILKISHNNYGSVIIECELQMVGE